MHKEETAKLMPTKQYHFTMCILADAFQSQYETGNTLSN